MRVLKYYVEHKAHESKVNEKKYYHIVRHEDVKQ